jgi:hypothetical protein
LTFQPGQFVRFAQDFARLKTKIHKLHPSYLYQMSSSLVKGNLSSYSYFFQRHQTKSETGAKQYEKMPKSAKKCSFLKSHPKSCNHLRIRDL